jgi:[ribosomal protein S5]-alanine N-acetyltransferase
MMVQPLTTQRLTLIPCSIEVANAAYGSKRHLESLVGARLESTWLDDDGRGLLSYYAGQMNYDPAMLGWGLWLIQHSAQGIVFGSIGFKGKPNADGMVEIGYGIAPPYRRQGYTFEAARALVNWAFAQPGVAYITAECLLDNYGSARILEKLGMRRTGVQGSYIKWELKPTAEDDEQ